MAKKYYVTSKNYSYNKAEKEVNTAPSQTVPGQAMTMREILARYQEGMDPTRKRVEYFDVDELENINRFFAPGALDLTDIDALNENVTRLQQVVEEAHQRSVIERDKKRQEDQKTDDQKNVEEDNGDN